MYLKKWIQRRVLDVIKVVITGIDPQVVEEWIQTIDMNAITDHSFRCCGCGIFPEKLRQIEQEWVERHIIA